MKFKQKVWSALTVLSLTVAGLVQANGLANDPFVREAINRQNFEPGGKYHLFGSRGTTADRKGNIAVLPVSSQNVGGLLLEQALINGKITYNVRFSDHEHDEHAPFTNSNSRSDSDTKGQALIGFTSYKLNWNGKEVHPADAYDGAQGSGYPAPTGARDEYTYNIKGNAARVEVQFDDNRSTLQRFKDRFNNAGDMLTNGLSNDWQKATTNNPNLNFWGNKAEIANAVVSGVGNITGAGFEVLGAGDAAQLAGSLKDIGTMEAIRAMPAEAQLEAVAGLIGGANAYDREVVRYAQWKEDNPNLAETIGFARNIADIAFKNKKSTASSSASNNDIPTEAYDRKKHYGGSQTDSPAAQAARAEGEGKPCPTCGQIQISGTPTAPSPQHEPPLVKHYYEHDGYKMSQEERERYAREEGINGTQCLTCQRKEGGIMSQYSREQKKKFGLD